MRGCARTLSVTSTAAHACASVSMIRLRSAIPPCGMRWLSAANTRGSVFRDFWRQLLRRDSSAFSRAAHASTDALPAAPCSCGTPIEMRHGSHQLRRRRPSFPGPRPDSRSIPQKLPVSPAERTRSRAERSSPGWRRAAAQPRSLTLRSGSAAIHLRCTAQSIAIRQCTLSCLTRRWSSNSRLHGCPARSGMSGQSCRSMRQRKKTRWSSPRRLDRALHAMPATASGALRA